MKLDKKHFSSKSFIFYALLFFALTTARANEQNALKLVGYFDAFCVKNSEDTSVIGKRVEYFGGHLVDNEIAAEIESISKNQNGKTYTLKAEGLPGIFVGYNPYSCSIAYKDIASTDINWAINKLYKISAQTMEKDGAQNVTTFKTDEMPSSGPGYIYHITDSIGKTSTSGILSFVSVAMLNRAKNSSTNSCGLPNELINSIIQDTCANAGEDRPKDEVECMIKGLTNATRTSKAQIMLLRSCGEPERAAEFESNILQIIQKTQKLYLCAHINIDYMKIWSTTELELTEPLQCQLKDSPAIKQKIQEDIDAGKNMNQDLDNIIKKFRIK